MLSLESSFPAPETMGPLVNLSGHVIKLDSFFYLVGSALH